MLDDLILTASVLEANALVVERAAATALWLAPGAGFACAVWAAYRATTWIHAGYRACRRARAELHRLAGTAAEDHAAITQNAAAEAEARIQRLTNELDLDALYHAPDAEDRN